MQSLPKPVVIQGVSPKTIAAVLHQVESGRVTSGPICAYDKERAIFLVAVVEQGIVISHMQLSCPTSEAAEVEKERVLLATQLARRISVGGNAKIAEEEAFFIEPVDGKPH